MSPVSWQQVLGLISLHNYMSQNLKRNLCLSAHITYTCIYLYRDIIYIYTHISFFFFSWRTLIQLGSQAQSPNSPELWVRHWVLELSWPSNQISQKVAEMMTLQVAVTSHPWQSSRVVFQRLSRPRIQGNGHGHQCFPLPLTEVMVLFGSKEQGHSGIHHRTSKEILAAWQCVAYILFFCFIEPIQGSQSNQTSNA